MAINIEARRECNKRWRLKNKEKLARDKKQYYENNRFDILKAKKKYNKEKENLKKGSTY